MRSPILEPSTATCTQSVVSLLGWPGYEDPRSRAEMPRRAHEPAGPSWAVTLAFFGIAPQRIRGFVVPAWLSRSLILFKVRRTTGLS